MAWTETEREITIFCFFDFKRLGKFNLSCFI